MSTMDGMDDMDINPRQTDPQFQSPNADDSERQAQFGMQSQADVPLQGSAAQPGQSRMPGATGGVSPSSIVPGTDVYGSDGNKVGTAHEVYDDSFLVQRGIFLVRDYYIPLSYVARATHERVDLLLTSDEAKSRDWSTRPGSSGPIGQGQIMADPASYGVYGPVGAGDTMQSATERGAPAATTPAQGSQLPPTTGPGTPGPGAPLQEPGAPPTPGAPGTTPTDMAPDYGTQVGTPASGVYGPAGQSDTIQQATNRGVQGDQTDTQSEHGDSA